MGRKRYLPFHDRRIPEMFLANSVTRALRLQPTLLRHLYLVQSFGSRWNTKLYLPTKTDGIAICHEVRMFVSMFADKDD